MCISFVQKLLRICIYTHTHTRLDINSMWAVAALNPCCSIIARDSHDEHDHGNPYLWELSLCWKQKHFNKTLLSDCCSCFFLYRFFQKHGNFDGAFATSGLRFKGRPRLTEAMLRRTRWPTRHERVVGSMAWPEKSVSVGGFHVEKSGKIMAWSIYTIVI